MATTETQTDSSTLQRELARITQQLEGTEPEDALRWALQRFGRDVALATGFGVEGCVLIDMLSRIDNNARFFYLDTDLLFPETYDLAQELEHRYSIRFERHASEISISEQADLHGHELWAREPDRCCNLRKVEPLKRLLSGLDAWITAIRRDQSAKRATAQIVEWDAKFELVKINPLAGWSSKDVWTYIREFEVPHNKLYQLGYASIGCTPCTTPVRIGEDARAGRWRGAEKTECGLHS